MKFIYCEIKQNKKLQEGTNRNRWEIFLPLILQQGPYHQEHWYGILSYAMLLLISLLILQGELSRPVPCVSTVLYYLLCHLYADCLHLHVSPRSILRTGTLSLH